MKIQTILTFLESIAPPNLQEDYDNAGLIVGDPQAECRGVLFSLDSTEKVVDEAIRKNCNLIVAHHPIVFRGLKKLNGANYVERTVIKAIKNDVAIFAIHTNLDNVHQNGVNQKIAQKLGLQNTKILLPKPELNDSEIGAGLIGELAEPISEKEFLQKIKTAMQAEVVRHTELLGKPVQRVAVCGGSGSFLLSAAIKSGADFFVSADFKYHEFFDADGRIVIADIGHFESEQFTIDLLHELVLQKFPTFALQSTEVQTNPVFYFF